MGSIPARGPRLKGRSLGGGDNAVLEKAVLIPALVFLAVMFLGLYLLKWFRGGASMAVFALFTLLACLAAFMTSALLIVPRSDS